MRAGADCSAAQRRERRATDGGEEEDDDGDRDREAGRGTEEKTDGTSQRLPTATTTHRPWMDMDSMVGRRDETDRGAGTGHTTRHARRPGHGTKSDPSPQSPKPTPPSSRLGRSLVNPTTTHRHRPSPSPPSPIPLHPRLQSSFKPATTRAHHPHQLRRWEASERRAASIRNRRQGSSLQSARACVSSFCRFLIARLRREAKPAMGCVCSRRFPEDEPAAPGSLATAYDARRGRYGPGDFDSGELAIPPPKPPHSHKVPTFPSVAGCGWLLPPLPPSLSLNAARSFLPPPRHASRMLPRLSLPYSVHAWRCGAAALLQFLVTMETELPTFINLS